MVRRLIVHSVRVARRIVVAVVGATVLLLGVALLVLPGPAMLVIPVGLAILGVEFAWARHWLRKLRAGANGVVQAASSVLNAGRRDPAPGRRGDGDAELAERRGPLRAG